MFWQTLEVLGMEVLEESGGWNSRDVPAVA
jgi:hypothetical protein